MTGCRPRTGVPQTLATSLPFLPDTLFLPAPGLVFLVVSSTAMLGLGWGSSDHHLKNIVSEESRARVRVSPGHCHPLLVCGRSKLSPSPCTFPCRAYLAGDKPEKEGSFKFLRRPLVLRI